MHYCVLCEIWKNLAKNEEKPCQENLQMSCALSTYGFVSEAGEFGLLF